MKVTPIKTSKILANSRTIYDVLDEFLISLPNKSIIVITSKILSLCENRVVDTDIKKDDLIRNEAELFLDKTDHKYGITFTIKNRTLIPTAGIDESNTKNHYVLWPKDSQYSANKIREYLCKKFSIQHVGVIISDSTCSPLRLGTTGISLAHSGFAATNDYRGKQDIFGKPFKVSRSNIAGGLASSAVVAMGEGAEQTPLCLISDVDFVKFQSRNPTKKEISMLMPDINDDLFEPFLSSVNWQSGNANNTDK